MSVDDQTAGSGFSIAGAEPLLSGAVIHVETVKMRTPGGDIVDRQVARHPGAVAVVAIHEGHVVLVRQYRVAIDAETIEIPAGKRDIAGELPEVAAARELVEEVGLEPQNLELLGSFLTAVGFCDEEILIYATSSCIAVERAVDGIEEAHSTIMRIPVADIDAWLFDGRLTDAKTLIGLFWARERSLLSPDG